jgi:hypothetical protein
MRRLLRCLLGCGFTIWTADSTFADPIWSNKDFARPANFDAAHFRVTAEGKVDMILLAFARSKDRGNLSKFDRFERRVIEQIGWIIVAIGEYVPPDQQYEDLLARIEKGMGHVRLPPEYAFSDEHPAQCNYLLSPDVPPADYRTVGDMIEIAREKIAKRRKANDRSK